MVRIQAIENNVNNYKSIPSSPKAHGFQHYNMMETHMKKSSSVADTSRIKIYSIDELSQLIVELEKNQADIKERLSQSSYNDQKVLKSEITVNEIKLKEIRDLQEKLLRVSKPKYY